MTPKGKGGLQKGRDLHRLTQMEHRNSRAPSSTSSPLSCLLPSSALQMAITHFLLHPVAHTVGSLRHPWAAAETGAQEREDPASGHSDFKGQILVIFTSRLLGSFPKSLRSNIPKPG